MGENNLAWRKGQMNRMEDDIDKEKEIVEGETIEEEISEGESVAEDEEEGGEYIEYDIYEGYETNKLKIILKKVKVFMKKKPVRIATQILSSLLVLAIAGFIGIFLAVGTQKGSPVTFAKEYFEYYANRNWNSMYKATEIEESKFINIKTFSIAMNGNALTTGIENYEFEFVKENDKFAYVDVTYDLVYEEDEEESTPETEDETTEGESEAEEEKEKTGKYSMIIKKQSEKILFFYSTWKGYVDTYIINNCKIEAPEEMTVTFDGVDLSDCVKGKNEETGNVIYDLGRVFKGEHKIALSSPFIDNKTELVTWTDNGSSYVASSGGYDLKNEHAKFVKNNSRDIVAEFYRVALEDGDKATIKALIRENEEKYQQIDEQYSALLSQINQSDGRSLISMSFDKCEYEISDYEYLNKLTVNISYTCTYQALRPKTLIDGRRLEYEGTNLATAKVFFEYIDGTWQAVGTEVGCIDYTVEKE